MGLFLSLTLITFPERVPDLKTIFLFMPKSSSVLISHRLNSFGFQLLYSTQVTRQPADDWLGAARTYLQNYEYSFL